MANTPVWLAMGLFVGLAQAGLVQAAFTPCVPGMLEDARDNLIRQGYDQVRVGFRTASPTVWEVVYSYRASQPANLFGFGKKYTYFAGTDTYDTHCRQVGDSHPVRVSEDPTGGRE